MTEEMYAGVDLGGTNVACALGAVDGTLLAERAIPTESHAGPAAVLGALEDDTARAHSHCLVANAGNFHALAFHLRRNRILGIVEHHSSALDADKLDALLDGMVHGTLRNEDVFNDGGHGCLVLGTASRRPFLTLTGPRRALAAGSKYHPYLAAPHGDMMLTGCYGLLRAFADRMDGWRGQIDQSLRS